MITVNGSLPLRSRIKSYLSTFQSKVIIIKSKTNQLSRCKEIKALISRDTPTKIRIGVAIIRSHTTVASTSITGMRKTTVRRSPMLAEVATTVKTTGRSKKRTKGAMVRTSLVMRKKTKMVVQGEATTTSISMLLGLLVATSTAGMEVVAAVRTLPMVREIAMTTTEVVATKVEEATTQEGVAASVVVAEDMAIEVATTTSSLVMAVPGATLETDLLVLWYQILSPRIRLKSNPSPLALTSLS